jgi:hypothetical protein
MANKTCPVCSGKGTLWETPFLLNVMTCWRCIGKGAVPDERDDNGESNG